MGPRQYARTLKGLIEAALANGDRKLALEITREWGRNFELKKNAAAPVPDVPVNVQLVHAVPRPARATTENRN